MVSSKHTEERQFASTHECCTHKRMLLDVYIINLPMNSDPDVQPGREDHVSNRILQLCHPILLTTHIPLSVEGDSNCLHRATSLALYGTEEKHYQLPFSSSSGYAPAPGIL